MSLIEKKDVLHQIGILPLVWEYGQGVNDCYEIVKQAPEVDAIPIEWIKKYAEEHRAYIHEFKNMLAEWSERKKE